jgi:regulator of sirC expression with transglutaminase-like and TPR domain
MREKPVTPSEPSIIDEQTSLLKLLGDDDPIVWESVRKKIISYGCDVMVWLKPHCTSNDRVLRRHALDIVHHFERQMNDRRFAVYCTRNDRKINLEEGALMMAATQYPDINCAGYSALLDDFARRLRSRIADSRVTSPIVPANEFLFDEERFAGDLETYYCTDNCFINKVIDRRSGNPVSLCLVYFLIMRRLGYSVGIVGMPGHTVCRLQHDFKTVYIDVFNLGRVISRAECIEHIRKTRNEIREEYLTPLTDRRVLARMCGNLQQTYLDLKQKENAGRVSYYVQALLR